MSGRTQNSDAIDVIFVRLPGTSSALAARVPYCVTLQSGLHNRLRPCWPVVTDKILSTII
jgi:hypothetical protein